MRPHRFFVLAPLLALVVPSALFAASIVVGTHTLLPDTPGQVAVSPDNVVIPAPTALVLAATGLTLAVAGAANQRNTIFLAAPFHAAILLGSGWNRQHLTEGGGS